VKSLENTTTTLVCRDSAEKEGTREIIDLYTAETLPF
jgi:hypothetical protein